MSISLTVNGTTYTYPERGDTNWGNDATDWASAVSTSTLQKTGGIFALTADASFGASFGLKSLYYKTGTSNIAASGEFRLAKTDTVTFRNNANSNDIELGIDSSDNLTWNSAIVRTGLVVNADVNASAAIALSKLAATTASKALVSDGSGFISASSVTSTELGYVSGVTSAIQTQIGTLLPKAGGTVTGTIDLVANKATTTYVPVNAADLTNKLYVDAVASGLQVHTAVRAGTTVAGTLATSFENGDVIDGVTLATNDRILIKNQVTAYENGIYTVNASGAPTRATDADTWTEMLQAYVLVTAGSTLASSGWKADCIAGGTINSTAINWAQFTAAAAANLAGVGLLKTGVTFDVQYDNSTININGSNQIIVKTGGITNTQISASAAIAASKLVGTDINTVGTVTTGTWSATTVALNKGGTGQTTKSAAFDALQPMTTAGDMILGGASGTGGRLAVGTVNQVLTSTGTTAVWSDPAFIRPTIQKMTSGTGTLNSNYAFTITSGSASVGDTYTTNSITYTIYKTISSETLVYATGSNVPAAQSGTLTRASGAGDATLTFTAWKRPLYLRVRMVGGGGGSSGSGTASGGSGGLGGTSTFGTYLSAGGGSGGVYGTSGGGAGGTATITLYLGTTINGQKGHNGPAVNAGVGVSGRDGGMSQLGPGGVGLGVSGAGVAAVANSGGGGAGACTAGTSVGGSSSGGGGGYLEVLIPNTTLTNAYEVGAGGTAGTTTTGDIGAAGGSGFIIVEEFYQ